MVVEPMQLPPLRGRDERRAIRTRLARYVPGSDLCLAVHPYPKVIKKPGKELLAAVVDATLSRGLLRACRRAGLRVGQVSALAGLVPPPPDCNRAVQLVLTERTTSIQLFNAGRLVSCRDVLLGRRDFVAACQRPILTENGVVTLTAAEAEEICRAVGVPVGREDEIRPGVYAAQLWPTLSPVLQRLRHEVEQTLAHSQVRVSDVAVSVAGAPLVPGLAEFLADDLQLAGVALPAERAEAHFLAGLAGQGHPRVALDLRPPEERFNDRLIRPALAAGLCALFVIFADSAGPRQAAARLAEFQPLAARLNAQVDQVEQQRAAVALRCEQLSSELRRRTALTKVLPPVVPAAETLKYVFRELPEHFELLDVQLAGQTQPPTLDLRGTYQADVPASVVAAQWARELGTAPFVVGAKVVEVSGRGQSTPAQIAVQAQLK
jgi:hypothetical protein